MKKFGVIPFLILVIMMVNNIIYAGTFHSVDMDVLIDKNGDAHVTEVWDYTTNEGTENYKTYKNIGNSTIVNLEVKDGEKQFETLKAWDVNASFSEKANKCGINEISNGVELCWGIGNYGRHTYTITYVITDFVSQLTDAQMVYWELIPKGQQIGNVNITIRSDIKYSDTSVWGYGYKDGICEIQNGQVVMNPNRSILLSEYMTVLIQFPNGTFNTDNIIDKNFNYYLEMSQKGTTSVDWENVFNIIGSICLVLFFLSIPVFAYIFDRYSGYDFGETGKKIPKDTPLYRDIPLKDNLYRAYFISTLYGITKDKTNLLGAMLLKWLKEKKITIEITDRINLLKKEETVIVFDSNLFIEDELEYNLYKYFVEASKDNRLASKEFKKWCGDNNSEILNWFDEVDKKALEDMVRDGLSVPHYNKVLFIKLKKHKIDSSVMEYAKQLAGLKKYLLDFTLISKREAPEVALFEDYLIYAQLMGIADKVAKQFKEVYPAEIYAEYEYNCDTVLFLSNISRAGISSARSAQSSRSYGGGGGGSFGGGGSMGSR